MAKFWQSWRADEIVAVYQGRDKDGKLTKDVKVHLRSGGTGTAYGCDSDKERKEEIKAEKRSLLTASKDAEAKLDSMLKEQDEVQGVLDGS